MICRKRKNIEVCIRLGNGIWTRPRRVGHKELTHMISPKMKTLPLTRFRTLWNGKVYAVGGDGSIHELDAYHASYVVQEGAQKKRARGYFGIDASGSCLPS